MGRRALVLATLLAWIVSAHLGRLRAVAPANGRQILASASALGRGFSDTAALEELRSWTAVVSDWWHTGELTRVSVESDALVAGRTHEHFVQGYRGVPVWSGDVRRQLNAFGQTESIFGTYYPGIDVDITPTIPAATAATTLAEAGGGSADPASSRLVILPTNDGFHLAWTARVLSTADARIRRIFVDAKSGTVLLNYDDTWTAPASGQSGDRAIVDMHGDADRLVQVLAGTIGPTAPATAATTQAAGLSADVAQSALQLAQVFFLERFARHGLDNLGRGVRVLINPLLSSAPIGSKYLAFAGDGAYYGSGDIVLGLHAGNLDPPDLAAVVGHEYAHGITEYSSGLLYLNEAGTLNEAFSEVMGAAIARTAHPPASTNPVTQVVATAVMGSVDPSSGETIQGVGLEHRDQLERVMYRAFTLLLPTNATFTMARDAMMQAAVDLYGADSASAHAIAAAWHAMGVEG